MYKHIYIYLPWSEKCPYLEIAINSSMAGFLYVDVWIPLQWMKPH